MRNIPSLFLNFEYPTSNGIFQVQHTVFQVQHTVFQVQLGILYVSTTEVSTTDLGLKLRSCKNKFGLHENVGTTEK